MGYGKTIHAAAEWLMSTRGTDFGWGVTPGAASSIVNTAEAIYVLKRAGRLDACSDAASFIRHNLFEHVERLGPRVRYVAFGLIALCELNLAEDSTLRDRCTDWLLNARNQDGAWGHVTADQNSLIFPTFLAAWALSYREIAPKVLEPTFHWVASGLTDRGWSLDRTVPSSVASAYAMLIFQLFGRDHPVLQNGRLILDQTTHWGFIEEHTPGTVWKHHDYPWVIWALARAGEDIFSPVIANAVRYMNDLRRDRGWSEIPGRDALTPRSQFWGAVAIDSLSNAFNPVVDVPRIDAERTGGALLEPTFMKVAMHTKWAMIIPLRLYRSLVYSLLILALFLISGAVEQLPHWSSRFSSLIALCAIALSFYLIHKRSKYFGRMKRIVAMALVGLSFLDLWFGISILEAIESVSEAIKSLGHGFKTVIHFFS